jgi:hypothetical protein
MATPSEVAGDESGGETGRSGDHDPIPLDLLLIRCPKHPRAVMESSTEMLRWAAGLQAAAELLHRRSMLAWRTPTVRLR